MKRLLLFMATVAMLLVSCNPLEKVDPILEVDKESVSLSAVGGAASFTVNSNQDWTVTVDQTWVKLNVVPSDATMQVTVNVTADDNPAYEERTAVITLTAGELTKTVSVTQAAAEPPVYELDGKQWVFDWEPLSADAIFDFGVTEEGKFYFAYDLAVIDPSMAGTCFPIYEGTYIIEKGEDLNAGVVKLVLVDTVYGEEISVDMPYTLTAENAATFDTTALEEMLEVTSVSATAATEKYDIYIQTIPELPAEMDVVAVALAGEYYGNADQEAYNYYFVVADEDAVSSDMVSGVGVAIDLYSEVPVGDGENIVPTGEYVFDPDDTFEAGTFSYQYSYVLIDGIQYGIYDGVVYVKEDGVDMELLLETGTTLYVEYSGVPDMGAAGGGDGEGAGNLTEDVEMLSENGLIIAQSYGDYYEVGMDNWMISIFADGETFSGDALMFEILTDGEGIVGEYEVFTDEAEELYNCFLPGEYEVEDGYIYPYCSWYMTVTEGEMDGDAYSPIVDGEFCITESDGIYTVEFDLYDDRGNNICGLVAGEGEVYDEEGNPMASMAKAQAKNGRKAVAKKGFKTPAKNTIVLKKK